MSYKDTAKYGYDKTYKAKKKQQAIDMLGGRCVSCGTVERLEFDHVNRDRVGMTVTTLIGHSWKKVLEELKKCQLLCQPCHSKKSHAERGHTGLHDHGTTSRYRLDKCRCDDCRSVHSSYLKQWRNNKKLDIV